MQVPTLNIYIHNVLCPVPFQLSYEDGGGKGTFHVTQGTSALTRIEWVSKITGRVYVSLNSVLNCQKEICNYVS